MFGLFSKKKESINLRFDDIREFIDVRTEKDFSDTSKKVKENLDEILNEVKKLKNHFEELKEITSDNNFSNTIKNKYCDRCLEMFNFDAPGTEYNELNKFIDRVDDINKSANNLTVKEFRHMRDFRAKMGRISLQTKIIDKRLKNLQNAIKKSVLENKEKMKKCLDWIDEIKQSISSVENEKEEVRNRKEQLGVEIEKLEDELDGFEKNGTQSEFDKELKNMEAMEKERDMIKQQVETEFGGINRPLKKLQYALDSGEVALLKEEKNMLVQYLDNPDTFLVSDGNNVIRSLINQIKNLENKNVIELSSKEKEKVYGTYGNLSFLLSLKRQYVNLVKNIRQKEETIKSVYLPFAERKKDAQNQKEKNKNEIERLDNDLKKKDEEIEKLRKKIASNISALQIMINDFLDVDAKISY